MTYASGTSVTVRRSREEIERTLEKYKATHIGVMTEPGKATVLFRIGEWSVCFKMPLPDVGDALMHRVKIASRPRWLEQTTRERWRALSLTIKAKLVSVEARVETFEEAFLAHLVLGGKGETVGEQTIPRLRDDNRKLLSPGSGEG